ncbi:MAG: hypothetical protein LBB16_03495 [Puniceicoccales bacterium]|jgi:hypothetical protein|nr:hypothetical protein [Puniceicoccales bacterium]
MASGYKNFDIKEKFFRLLNPMDEISVNSVRKLESPSTTSNGSKIKVKNDAITLSAHKTNIQRREIGNFSIASVGFDANVYAHMLSRAPIAFDRVPIHIFASQAFISESLKFCPKELIDHMNSWSSKQMSDFIKQYDILPEAMLGRLFSEGLNPTFIPKDVKLSPAFLRVATNTNPDRLTTEILNKEDIQSVRLAMSNLDDSKVEKLWNNGMSTAKLPTAKSSNAEFIARIRLKNPERLKKEIQNPINAMLRSRVEHYSLDERVASTPK